MFARHIRLAIGAAAATTTTTVVARVGARSSILKSATISSATTTTQTAAVAAGWQWQLRQASTLNRPLQQQQQQDPPRKDHASIKEFYLAIHKHRLTKNHSAILDSYRAFISYSPKKPTANEYSVVLSAAAKLGDLLTLESVYKDALDSGQELDPPVFHSIMSPYATRGMVKRVNEIFNDLKQRTTPNEATYVILMRVNAIVGNMDEVSRLFAELMTKQPHPQIHTLTTLMFACRESGLHDQILKVYRTFPKLGLEPDIPVYRLVLYACQAANDIESLQNVLNEMEAKKLPTLSLIVPLVEVYCYLGEFNKAIEYAFLHSEKVVRAASFNRKKSHYRILVAALADAQRVDDLVLVYNMAKEREIADRGMFGALRNAFRRLGEMRKSAEVRSYMNKRNWEDDQGMYQR